MKLSFKFVGDQARGAEQGGMIGNTWVKNGTPMEIDGDRLFLDGRRLDLALSPADVHDPTELPTYLAGYRAPKIRHMDAVPIIPSDKDSDKYRTFSSDDTFEPVAVKGSIEGSIPEVSVRSSLTDYKVVDRFLGSFISDVTEQNAGPNYRPRQVAMRRCAKAIDLDLELDVFGATGLLTQTANWNSNNHTTLAAGAKWNGGASSDPPLDIQTRMEASAQDVTDIFFNRRVANAFLRHASVRDMMRQMLGDGAVNAAVAAVSSADTRDSTIDFVIPGFPPFHVVASKVKLTSLDYVLGNHVVLVCRPPGVPQDGEDISTAYNFRRKGGAGVGYETREIRIDTRGPRGGTLVVVSEASIPTMTGNNCGGLILSAWQ